MAKTARQNMLAKVHLAKKDLGLSDADYQHVLWVNFGVESSASLSDRGLNDLLNHFKSKGWQGKPKRSLPGGNLNLSPRAAMCRPTGNTQRDWKPEVAPERQPLMDKIEAQLSELGRIQGRRVPWAYAAAILKRQGGPDFLNWATAGQLQTVVQSLAYAVKRAAAKAGKGE